MPEEGWMIQGVLSRLETRKLKKASPPRIAHVRIPSPSGRRFLEANLLNAYEVTLNRRRRVRLVTDASSVYLSVHTSVAGWTAAQRELAMRGRASLQANCRFNGKRYIATLVLKID